MMRQSEVHAAGEKSDCLGWSSLAGLLGDHPHAAVALIGCPLGERSLTPGRCDLAPAAVRASLPRLSIYDVETRTDLSGLTVHDLGDLDLKLMSPEAAFAPISAAVREACARREMVIVLGGNNAVTRPAVHGLGPRLETVGVLTLDAHFDLRDTDCGLTNGNPIQALLEDGLEGRAISQIGLAPFANTRRAHEKAIAAGISVHTLAACRTRGVAELVAAELQRLSQFAERIYVDFDIDVIDRGQFPAAPGARPGGISVHEFFACARLIGAHPKVRAVDLTEFDPSLDSGGVGGLVAARWVAELLSGFQGR